MFKVIEYLSDGRFIIHGYDETRHNAELRYDWVTTMGRCESFSFVVIEEVTKC